MKLIIVNGYGEQLIIKGDPNTLSAIQRVFSLMLSKQIVFDIDATVSDIIDDIEPLSITV
jgi:hypothetical protein